MSFSSPLELTFANPATNWTCLSAKRGMVSEEGAALAGEGDAMRSVRNRLRDGFSCFAASGVERASSFFLSFLSLLFSFILFKTACLAHEDHRARCRFSSFLHVSQVIVMKRRSEGTAAFSRKVKKSVSLSSFFFFTPKNPKKQPQPQPQPQRPSASPERPRSAPR